MLSLPAVLFTFLVEINKFNDLIASTWSMGLFLAIKTKIFLNDSNASIKFGRKANTGPSLFIVYPSNKSFLDDDNGASKKNRTLESHPILRKVNGHPTSVTLVIVDSSGSRPLLFGSLHKRRKTISDRSANFGHTTSS